MLYKIVSFYIFLLVAFSCKSPEARRPVQQSSGTFIQESAQRNKALYDEEKEHIQ
ncbi:MAG TPA: gliding motility-associated peptidyl-prolyl isomerase GldI, partial [Flavobacteriaceae bacterium]|nr:gliding motility-associated peptidyl-prolyl isomerase GldI [Flavobacteriaceae bacterium]